MPLSTTHQPLSPRSPRSPQEERQLRQTMRLVCGWLAGWLVGWVGRWNAHVQLVGLEVSRAEPTHPSGPAADHPCCPCRPHPTRPPGACSDDLCAADRHDDCAARGHRHTVPQGGRRRLPDPQGAHARRLGRPDAVGPQESGLPRGVWQLRRLRRPGAAAVGAGALRVEAWACWRHVLMCVSHGACQPAAPRPQSPTHPSAERDPRRARRLGLAGRLLLCRRARLRLRR